MLFHSNVREQSSVAVPNMIRRWHAVAVRVRCSVLCKGRLHRTLPDSSTTQCILPRQDVPYSYKMAKYSQNTTIFIHYERADHIAVYNYITSISHLKVPYSSSYVAIFREMFMALSLLHVKRAQQKLNQIHIR